ncbi:hypothetical protein COY93_02530 [Candidatus Uhrbacteria bacterium CG_4_10_14_0_8_um_filter_58_22]|uniref:Methyltransferase type 11 domain-containing protein n=1 Tax=Candidatus Uhrbacteria bacterium CG_4_10_14_0_8_um_filter_58_22 TaxID=1975029 RepID=A0A2M7QAX6_9BACT|nr:MAG: hypothetical protein COY93_02530 [Candidatus Uhrbacteria bacterium CG_4_10_14_0_8_um_filter_58_22]
MPSGLTEKQRIERETFDFLVREKTAGRTLAVSRIQPSFADYNGDLFFGALRHVDVRGRRILEIGCGSGEISVWFALNGAASVCGVDISGESIRIAERRAIENSVTDRVKFITCPGESVPLPDGSFDSIFINVALHHLELETALGECRRLLSDGGQFLAVEPLVRSRFLQRVRETRFFQRLYPIRRESLTERILDLRDIRRIRERFGNLTLEPHRVFSPFVYKVKPVFRLLARLFFPSVRDQEERSQRCVRLLQRADDLLLRLLPPLAVASRYSILVARRESRKS